MAELDDAEGKEAKVDVQHNSVATVSSTADASSSKGLGGMAFGLAPVAPAVWLGAAATGNVQPWQSSRESRSQKTVAEPRVLRSDKGSVEVLRKVRYSVRLQTSGTQDEQTFQGSGTLIQRVPTEHLVPVDTVAPHVPEAVRPETAGRVRLADSMAPVGVADTAAPHQGGGGLFDAVASVLHPSVTAQGAPGRARLYQATSTATVLEDLPRLLGDGVVGEDLQAKDGSTVSSYRVRAEITGLSPAWTTGKTQLRTHQQTQQSATASAGKGRAIAGGVGPAIGRRGVRQRGRPTGHGHAGRGRPQGPVHPERADRDQPAGRGGPRGEGALPGNGAVHRRGHGAQVGRDGPEPPARGRRALDEGVDEPAGRRGAGHRAAVAAGNGGRGVRQEAEAARR